MQTPMEVKLDVMDCGLVLKLISCIAFSQVPLTSLSLSFYKIHAFWEFPGGVVV